MDAEEAADLAVIAAIALGPAAAAFKGGLAAPAFEGKCQRAVGGSAAVAHSGSP